MNAPLRPVRPDDQHTAATCGFGGIKARKIAAARAEWARLMQHWPGGSPLPRTAA